MVSPEEYDRAVEYHDTFTAFTDGTEVILETRVARRFLLGGTRFVPLGVFHAPQGRDISAVILGAKRGLRPEAPPTHRVTLESPW